LCDKVGIFFKNTWKCSNLVYIVGTRGNNIFRFYLWHLYKHTAGYTLVLVKMSKSPKIKILLLPIAGNNYYWNKHPSLWKSIVPYHYHKHYNSIWDYYYYFISTTLILCKKRVGDYLFCTLKKTINNYRYLPLLMKSFDYGYMFLRNPTVSTNKIFKEYFSFHIQINKYSKLGATYPLNEKLKNYLSKIPHKDKMSSIIDG